MAGLVDDEATFRGEIGMFDADVEPSSSPTPSANNVEKRMGWGRGETSVGSVGKAINTAGMGRVGILRASLDDS